ncbi:hypothetical protein DFH09DRAFT_447610 [Mycena vulgaris]|nr:hypothetical protein DFH09DRAFT_447610 [Mycena vulgaris]
MVELLLSHHMWPSTTLRKHTPGVPCYCSICENLRDMEDAQRALWVRSVITLAPSSQFGPPWLFHGTTIANAQRIMQDGPSLPQMRNGAPSPGQFSYHGAFYLTDRPEAAAEYARGSGASHIVVLAFPWDGTRLRVQHFSETTLLGFQKYFIFSMINFGADVTTIFSLETFKRLGLVRAEGHAVRCMTLAEMRWKAAQTVGMWDVIAGPMLGVLSRDVWQYAITSEQGLTGLGRPTPQIYRCY